MATEPEIAPTASRGEELLLESLIAQSPDPARVVEAGAAVLSACRSESVAAAVVLILSFMKARANPEQRAEIDRIIAPHAARNLAPAVITIELEALRAGLTEPVEQQDLLRVAVAFHLILKHTDTPPTEELVAGIEKLSPAALAAGFRIVASENIPAARALLYGSSRLVRPELKTAAELDPTAAALVRRLRELVPEQQWVIPSWAKYVAVAIVVLLVFVLGFAARGSAKSPPTPPVQQPCEVCAQKKQETPTPLSPPAKIPHALKSAPSVIVIVASDVGGAAALEVNSTIMSLLLADEKSAGLVLVPYATTTAVQVVPEADLNIPDAETVIMRLASAGHFPRAEYVLLARQTNGTPGAVTFDIALCELPHPPIPAEDSSATKATAVRRSENIGVIWTGSRVVPLTVPAEAAPQKDNRELLRQTVRYAPAEIAAIAGLALAKNPKATADDYVLGVCAVLRTRDVSAILDRKQADLLWAGLTKYPDVRLARLLYAVLWSEKDERDAFRKRYANLLDADPERQAFDSTDRTTEARQDMVRKWVAQAIREGGGK
jgi:hypothetical protein